MSRGICLSPIFQIGKVAWLIRSLTQKMRDHSPASLQTLHWHCRVPSRPNSAIRPGMRGIRLPDSISQTIAGQTMWDPRFRHLRDFRDCGQAGHVARGPNDQHGFSHVQAMPRNDGSESRSLGTDRLYQREGRNCGAGRPRTKGVKLPGFRSGKIEKMTPRTAGDLRSSPVVRGHIQSL